MYCTIAPVAWLLELTADRGKGHGSNPGNSPWEGEAPAELAFPLGRSLARLALPGTVTRKRSDLNHARKGDSAKKKGWSPEYTREVFETAGRCRPRPFPPSQLSHD